MSATELLGLTADLIPILEKGLATAETKGSFLEINSAANRVMRMLNRLQQDEALKPEIISRAEIFRSGLQFIANESCEHYEQLGGFGFIPEAKREVPT
jgi:phosphomevalonate kinase